VIDLEGAGGLVSLVGRNDVEPALGANGAGKSTLFEALYWCLFGSTSRSLRAGDIASWDHDESPRVAVEFQWGTRPSVLERTWNPNTLTLGGSPVSQNDVEQTLGYTADTFLCAVFHAQFGQYFADLPAAQQLAVYTDVLRLDLWDLLSDMAAEQALAAEKEMQQIEVRAANAKGRLLEVRKVVDELAEKEHTWYRKRLASAKVNKRQLVELKAALTKHQRKLRVVEAQPKAKLGAKQSKLDELLLLETAPGLRALELSGTLEKLQQVLRNLRGMTRCPTCYQPVKAAVVEKEAREQHDAVERDLAAVRARLEKLVARRTAFQQEVAAELKAFGAADQARMQAINAAENAVLSVERDVREVSAAMRIAATQDCPYDTAGKQQELSKLEQEHARLYAQLQTTQAEAASNRYWVTAFREIRLSLIQKSLAQFEITTNNALRALGLEEWAVEYAVEAETKSGKLKRGFSIAVRSPYNSEPVPFAAWSGGESQRLRLAIALGLSDLIQDFAGNACNVEIFDEPTAHLSEQGIVDLLAALEQRARERQRTIWLADHRSLDYGGFARIVTVRKTAQGSELMEG
jgi:DNA repair exonuclease SbcCD ATPase subunit